MGHSLSGSAKPGAHVLLFDDAGDHAALQASELICATGARLEIMTDILTQAAERMQVILLTCRERAFRHVGGNRITLAS